MSDELYVTHCLNVARGSLSCAKASVEKAAAALAEIEPDELNPRYRAHLELEVAILTNKVKDL